MTIAINASTNISVRAKCPSAVSLVMQHQNLYRFNTIIVALGSTAHSSQSKNYRRCEMTIQTLQQAKASSALSRSQAFLTESPTVDDGVAHGFISYTVNAYFPDAGVNQQLVSVIQGGLAMEIVEILRMELDGAKFSITRYAREIEEFDVEARSTSRIKDVVIWLRDSQEPGKDFLTLIGYRGESEHQFDIGIPTFRPH